MTSLLAQSGKAGSARPEVSHAVGDTELEEA